MRHQPPQECEGVRRDGPEFFAGTALEVQAIDEAIAALKQPTEDMLGAYSEKRIASLKASADKIARLSFQINNLAAHLSSVCDRHVPTGSKS